MMEVTRRMPKVLVPFLGVGKKNQMDVVIYLRPESNGVDVESLLFQEIRQPEFVQHFELVYLANLPGSYLRDCHVIQDHYYQRIQFAQKGGLLFTDFMVEKFERFFGEKFQEDQVIGAYQALEEFAITPEELMDLWVPVYDLVEIHGQLIKRAPQGKWIVNYDIPGILEKYQEDTDVAAMVLRTDFRYEQFLPLIHKLAERLAKKHLLDPSKPVRRIFHYSKGPFEQILDAMGFLLCPNGLPEEAHQTQFFQYLVRKKVSPDLIWKVLKNPIVRLNWEGAVIEENMMTFTQSHNFKQALEKLQAVEEILSLV